MELRVDHDYVGARMSNHHRDCQLNQTKVYNTREDLHAGNMSMTFKFQI